MRRAAAVALSLAIYIGGRGKRRAVNARHSRAGFQARGRASRQASHQPRRRRRQLPPRRATPPAATTPGSPPSSAKRWRKAFRKPQIAAVAPHLTYDQKIIYIDRGQRVFTQTFLEFAGRMAAAYRIQRGQALIQANAATFARIEQQFGVPAPVIVAFWGLETDFGANLGKYSFVERYRLARLRLPAQRPVSRAAARRAASDRARRSHPGGHDRLVGRRAWPDADDAVGIQSIQRRLRRQRQARPHP